MKKQIILMLLIAEFPFTIFADNDKQDGTYLNISATERREVDEDLLVANLRFESEGQDAKDVQSDINSAMKKALDKAKELRDVKVSTERYSVYKYHPRTKRRSNKDCVAWKPVCAYRRYRC
jgi:predicted secreted protein